MEPDPEKGSFPEVGFGPDTFGEECLRNGQLEQSKQLKRGFSQPVGVIH